MRISRDPFPVAFCFLSMALWGACRDSTGPSGQPNPTDQPGASSPLFKAVSTGDNTTCALDVTGQAYCWGYNFRGALATGDTTYRVTRPRAVANQPGPFNSISVGAQHQCAIARDARAYCWGENQPPGLVPVVGDLSFASISVGFAHTCAITTDQTAYCWGDNTYGQLGAGAAAPCDYSNLPCRVNAPVKVAGGLRFIQITSGRDHTCGLTSDGSGYCWGENATGQLGNASIPINCGPFPAHAQCISDSPVPISGDLRFSQLSAGAFHTCGITTAGNAYCWGLVTADPAIEAYALGNASYSGAIGTQRGSQVPVPVSGQLTFRDITVGNGVSCGLTVNGGAVCWGRNNYGQMGVGGIDPFFTTTPLAVHMPAVQSAPAIDEDYHACALTTTGRIWCWGGLNFYGELGSGPVSEPNVSWDLRPVPTPIDAPR